MNVISDFERREIMTVTFCGHSELSDRDSTIRAWLSATVESLILRGAKLFYLGGYGDFDSMAASVVWEQKQKYPEIESLLVLPYLDSSLNRNGYDGTTYPPLEKVPRRFAIIKRNEWMVDNSSVLVGYVLYEWGGAVKTLKYAQRKKKEIILYGGSPKT